MINYNLKISTDDLDFSENLIFFLKEKSREFSRNSKIGDILEKDTKKENYFLNLDYPIHLDVVYGSTFQSKYRGYGEIYSITHYINYLLLENGELHANISFSKSHAELSGEPSLTFQFLRPTYYICENGNYRIATFDIDWNINDVA